LKESGEAAWVYLVNLDKEGLHDDVNETDLALGDLESLSIHHVSNRETQLPFFIPLLEEFSE